MKEILIKCAVISLVFLLAAGFWLRFKRGKWKAIEMIPQAPVVVPFSG